MIRHIILFFLLILFKTEAQTSVLNIADSLFQNGNYAKAIAQYQLYDNPSEVYDKIAKAYVAIGNYEEALNHYKSAITSNPEDALITYSYGKLLYKTKKFNESVQMFEKLISVDAYNPNYHYELGLVLEKLKDSTAFKKFHGAFKLDKFHQKAIFKIAKRHLIKRRHDSVNYYIDIGLKSYKNNVELISLKAQNFYWQHKYNKAAAWFEKLLGLGEQSEFIFEKLSLCYFEMSEYEKAIENRKLALKYNPKNADALYAIGSYHELLKNFEEAEKYITKALTLMDVPLHNEYKTLARVFNQQKKYKEAIEALKKAIKENPQDEFSHFFLAMTLSEYYADYDAKIQAFENYKKKFPNGKIKEFADASIQKLKEEQFKNQEKNTD